MDSAQRPDGADGHFHENSLHTGRMGHNGYPVHYHSADGRTHWDTEDGRPAGSGPDWKATAEVAVDEMERHARAIVATANLIRGQLGLGTVLQLRHTKRIPPSRLS